MTGAAHFFTIFRRELAAYFNAAIAYIFIIVFVVLNGGLFMTQFFVVGLADMRSFFATLPYFLAVFLPAVTMRLWSEERRGNTLELLLTFPMGTHALVLGKYLASLVFYLAALAGTLTIPVMLVFLGKPDMGTLAGGYVGALFLGAFFLAIGIFISGLCRDQIVSFILSLIVCFGLQLLGTGYLASSIDGWLPGLGSLLSYTLGVAPHYDSFAKGVIDNRDLLYFGVGAALFLALNGFWLEGRMRPGARKIFTGAVFISVGILLASNWLLSGFNIGRFDLTQGKIYTVSPASKKILSELKAPVTVKFYVSPQDKMPTGMKTMEQDVVSKLDEFRVASRGKLQYKIFHMEAANVTEAAGAGEETLESQLERKGIQPFQVRAIVSDEVAVRLVYAAMSFAYKEKAEEIIPRITPDNLNELEYLIISKVFRMTLPEIPKIALVAPYQEKQVEPELQALLSQLGGQVPEGYKDDQYEVLPLALDYEGYQVQRIRLDEKEPLPEGTKTLAVVEPEELNDRQQYEISRFLRGGGSVFMAVQQYQYSYLPEGGALSINGQPENPGVNSLLSSWGLQVDDQILVDLQHDVINISGAARLGPFDLTVPVKVPIQILINQDGMNQDLSITSRLSPIFYLWGTALKLDEAKIKTQGLNVQTLLHSSNQSWTVPFQAELSSPSVLDRKPGSAAGPFPLAIMAQGQFSDAFEGRAVPAWPKKENAEEAGGAESPAPSETTVPPPAVTPAPGKLILMGAATPFQKSLVKGGGHLNFFLNAIDVLTLGDELVTIRSKQPIDRSLGRVPTPVKVGWRFFVSFLVPALLAAIGAFRVLMRRRSKMNYMKALAAESI